MLVEKYMKCELVKEQREQEMTDYITVRECTSVRSFLTPLLAPCAKSWRTQDIQFEINYSKSTRGFCLVKSIPLFQRVY